jgi:hypothetical protein
VRLERQAVPDTPGPRAAVVAVTSRAETLAKRERLLAVARRARRAALQAEWAALLRWLAQVASLSSAQLASVVAGREASLLA